MSIKTEKNKLTIIIVNYNSSKKLNLLLVSLKYIEEIIREIIIIDNSSTDLSYLIIPKPLKKITKLLTNKTNLGFAKAVNQGIRISKNKYILLINPDCLIPPQNHIEKMFRYFLCHKNISVIGGQILSENNLPHSANFFKPSLFSAIFVFTNMQKLFPNNPYIKKFYPEKFQKINKPIGVDGLCAAFIIFKKYINKRINYFDKRFFLYLEDLDFCINNKKLGCQIIYFPKAKIFHEGGGSNKSKYKTMLPYWYESRDMFFQKYLSKVNYSIIKIIFNTEIRLLYLYHLISNKPTK